MNNEANLRSSGHDRLMPLGRNMACLNPILNRTLLRVQAPEHGPNAVVSVLDGVLLLQAVLAGPVRARFITAGLAPQFRDPIGFLGRLRRVPAHLHRHRHLLWPLLWGCRGREATKTAPGICSEPV